MELTDVLSDKDPEEVKTEYVAPTVEEDNEAKQEKRKEFQAQEAAAQEEGRKQARDEAGKFVAKEEPKPEVKPDKPEPQAMSDKERGLLAAATEERRKRQQLEQELAQLKAQPKAPAEPGKSFWDDPEGFLKQHEQTVAQTAQQAIINARIASSEAIAKSKYPDFEEKVAVFGEILQNTPGLQQYWLQQPDPAEFAYRTAKSVEELRQAGSVEAIKAEAEKAARIKLEAEYRAKEAALLKAKEEIPDSLSNARGTAQPRVAWGGPAPLENILKG